MLRQKTDQALTESFNGLMTTTTHTKKRKVKKSLRLSEPLVIFLSDGKITTRRQSVGNFILLARIKIVTPTTKVRSQNVAVSPAAISTAFRRPGLRKDNIQAAIASANRPCGPKVTIPCSSFRQECSMLKVRSADVKACFISLAVCGSYYSSFLFLKQDLRKLSIRPTDSSGS